MVGRIAYAISEKREFILVRKNMGYHTKSYLFNNGDAGYYN
tara:strand:+ start:357 stop:479 length:123 start_codon:yes stop_codon:yes gene_type:complete